MSNLASGGSLWTDRANDSAPATLSLAVLVRDGSGDLTWGRVGPAIGEAIDWTGTGEFEVLTFDPATPGGYLRGDGTAVVVPAGSPRATVMMTAAGDLMIF